MEAAPSRMAKHFLEVWQSHPWCHIGSTLTPEGSCISSQPHAFRTGSARGDPLCHSLPSDLCPPQGLCSCCLGYSAPSFPGPGWVFFHSFQSPFPPYYSRHLSDSFPLTPRDLVWLSYALYLTQWLLRCPVDLVSTQYLACWDPEWQILTFILYFGPES